jgi:hypothetical protein
MNFHRLSIEIGQAVRNFWYERTNRGIYLPRAKLHVNSYFTSWLNDGPAVDDQNVVTDEGIFNLETIFFAGGSVPAAFYIEPFSANAVPASSTTAANFNSTLTEQTNYSQAGRVAWTPGASSGGAIANTASPAQFTINAATQNAYGAGLVTVSTKLSGTGFLYAAAQFSTPKLAMGVGDNLYVVYTMSLVSS